ncbi:MAG: AAA family ATPase [Opitutaceae bacterium]
MTDIERRKGPQGLSEDSEGQGLIRLWLLRMLTSRSLMSSFVREADFRDDDIARELGLDSLIGVTPDGFNRSQIISDLYAMKAELEQRSATLKIPEHISKNCSVVADLLNLGAIEQRILEFEVMCCEYSVLNVVIQVGAIKKQFDYLDLIAKPLGLKAQEVRDAMRTSHSTLLSASIMRWGLNSCLQFLDGSFGRELVDYDCSLDRLIAAVVKKGLKPTLAYQDYPHLKDVLGHLRKHIRLAIKEKRCGVNVFIYGPPGTGKSELVRAIGREMRATTYEIAFQDSSGDPLDGSARLGSLRMAQPLLSRKRCILVYDEAEDVFSGESIFARSVAAKHKAWMNRQLETNPLPIFWVSNSESGVDPAFVRRFDFVLEIGIPPKAQRLKTYMRICKGKASRGMIEHIAECQALTPAVLTRATAVADRVCRTESPSTYDKTLSTLIGHTLKAQGHRYISMDDCSSEQLSPVYRLDYVNTEMPLRELPSQLKQSPSCRICLYGPPGTGKTALGYWLSKSLELPLLIKKASDLLSPYLGEAEKNIAEAFREAKTDRSILMIDEVDSFLQDRGEASRSWEVTQVNEMLTQIERFEGVFIASTNLMDGIDPAALRRFDLKLKFDYLRSEQAVGLMGGYAKQLQLGALNQATRGMLEALPNCTPGDFANVARQHRFRKFESPVEFVESVRAECDLKEGRGSKQMGF